MDENSLTGSRDYIDFAEILKTERSESDRRKVEEICSGDSTVAEKIRRIEEIDRNAAVYKRKKRISSKTEGNSSTDIPLSDGVSRKQAKYSKSSLKRRILKKGFFSFITSEIYKISAFTRDIGRRDDVLIIRFFPPGMRLNRRISVLWNQNIAMPAAELEPFLSYILAHEWRMFEKKDYNLIVQFRNLCQRIGISNINAIVGPGSDPLNRFRKLEQEFLACCYRPVYPERIIGLLKLVLIRYPDSKFDNKSLVASAKKLLEKNLMKPSLANIIVAFNILHYRRYIDFNDLIAIVDDDVIPDSEFDCTPEVQQEIDKYISKQTELLLRLVREKTEIEKYEAYLPVDQSGRLDFSLLEFYYDKTVITDKYKYATDLDMVPFFIVNCIRIFNQNFHQFLSGSVMFSDGSSDYVFEHGMFNEEIIRLSGLHDKLNRLHYEFKNFTRERMRQIENPVKQGTNTEMEIYSSIKEVLENLRSIANRLITLLNNSDASGVAPVPLSEKHVKSGELINKMKVSNVITDIIKFSLLAGALVSSSQAFDVVSRKDFLNDEISKQLADMKRIAVRQKYEEILSKAGRGESVSGRFRPDGDFI